MFLIAREKHEPARSSEVLARALWQGGGSLEPGQLRYGERWLPPSRAESTQTAIQWQGDLAGAGTEKALPGHLRAQASFGCLACWSERIGLKGQRREGADPVNDSPPVSGFGWWAGPCRTATASSWGGRRVSRPLGARAASGQTFSLPGPRARLPAGSVAEAALTANQEAPRPRPRGCRTGARRAAARRLQTTCLFRDGCH